ncbi:hypothetical protein ABET15_04360 [Heyndrickxia faecalis]|uniref:YqaI family protein n=1 Tax=Heyndrickxia TaxID=2837504 RepID=UPI0022367D41|nr:MULTISPECIES: hypothetical protein [Heyndrickxia]MED4866139.1 hypothetical protein [Weizmannia sp. CD-2023]UZH06433.1 hypothetical protein ONG97_00380 [Heyndrickxia coagulans]
MINYGLEHPEITRAIRTGYPNVVSQMEHWGYDYFGDEILVGDDVVEIDGETILQENWDRYVDEVLQARFFTAQ